MFETNPHLLATIILQSSKHLPRFLWFQNLSEANGDCSKRRNQNNFAQTEQTVCDMENQMTQSNKLIKKKTFKGGIT